MDEPDGKENSKHGNPQASSRGFTARGHAKLFNSVTARVGKDEG
jgi:hypothetical protein